MPGPAVVKVGGSLFDWPGFPAALASYMERLGPVPAVLVVGGGGLVDALRGLDSLHGIGDKRSHHLAVRTLEVTARLVADLVPGLAVVEHPDELAHSWKAGILPVLAPGRFLDEIDRPGIDPLPESWSATSDSIAAKVARHLGARLLLLKSAAPRETVSRVEAVRLGLVDPVFPRASAGLGSVVLVNLREPTPRPVELT